MLLQASPRAVEARLMTAAALALDIEQMPRAAAGPAPVRGGLAPWQCAKVARHIAVNFARDMQVSELAGLARLSVSHFTRAFRRSFGMPPYEAVSRYRISEAMRLMAVTDRPLAEIAGDCGFCDQSHFTRQFYRHAMISPGRWRRSRRTVN